MAREPMGDAIVFEVTNGRPVPSVPTAPGRLFTAREVGHLFGGSEETWRVTWENHFDPPGGPTPLFLIESRLPVPMGRGELPPPGRTCYTAKELSGADEPDVRHLLDGDWCYADLLAMHASTGEPAAAADSTEPADDGPFVTVVPVAAHVAKLTAAGLPPVAALYTVASIVLSDVGTVLDTPPFEWPEADADGVAERCLTEAWHDLGRRFSYLIERYTSADARRIINGMARKGEKPSSA